MIPQPLGQQIIRSNRVTGSTQPASVVLHIANCYTYEVNFKVLSRLAAIGVFGAFCGVLLGLGPAGATESLASAKSLTRLLEEHYRGPRTLQAVFLQRYSEGQKQERVESGTVYFRRPGQMRWEYDSPEKKLFLVDGKNTWFYVPYDRTVTRAPVKESSDWRTPLALLTGKADLSRLCSHVDLVTEKGVPPGHAVLRCLPKESKASDAEEYTEVLLELDSSTGELARIAIRQPGGIELEYRFGNWQ